MIAVRLPKDLEERLERLAKETGRTKTYYVREAILEHLAELEDIYLAEQVLERVRAGKEGVVELEAMIARYGLDD
jgi:RHH-type transcriptional regulator, rel operon repressor / antitoxin RelB